MQQPINGFNDEINQTISREGTHAEKYELRKARFGTEDILPMWIADQDIRTPEFILEAIRNRLLHPLLGYTYTDDLTFESIISWQAQYGLSVTKPDIVFTHNVANGFMMAVGAYTSPGDSVMLMPPVYPPFFDAITRHKCKIVEAPLELSDNRYTIDFERLEQKIEAFNVKLLLFCHPQNPSGRVWIKTELKQLAEICVKHQVTVVSDEIHSDLTYPPLQHTPLASINDEICQQTITLNSPGKTFNLGGLQIGYAIIKNQKLRKLYIEFAESNAIYNLNLLGQVALKAAYTEDGKQWRNGLLRHFKQNIELLESFFKEHLPQVIIMQPEASFLVWIDFRSVFNTHEALKTWIINEAKLGLNDGETFGGNSNAGTGFMRINIAVPTLVIEQAIHQLKSVILKI
jgi:cystathionine beta-lyase